MKRPVAWMKIYDGKGNYLASCVEPEGAAALVALAGAGATIRNGHALKNALWVEGEEAQSAGDSYDFVAQVVHERLNPIVDSTNHDGVHAGLEQAKAHVRSVLATIPAK